MAELSGPIKVKTVKFSLEEDDANRLFDLIRDKARAEEALDDFQRYVCDKHLIKVEDSSVQVTFNAFTGTMTVRTAEVS